MAEGWGEARSTASKSRAPQGTWVLPLCRHRQEAHPLALADTSLINPAHPWAPSTCPIPLPHSQLPVCVSKAATQAFADG